MSIMQWIETMRSLSVFIGRVTDCEVQCCLSHQSFSRFSRIYQCSHLFVALLISNYIGVIIISDLIINCRRRKAMMRKDLTPAATIRTWWKPWSGTLCRKIQTFIGMLYMYVISFLQSVCSFAFWLPQI